MPVLDGVVGVNQLLTINGKYYLAERATRGTTMNVQPVNLLQGTVRNVIQNIGAITETITIDAPILVGGGSYVDGRSLLNQFIGNAIDPSTSVLPLLQRGSIDISEQKASVNVTLLSDGNPSTDVFNVIGLASSALTDGTHDDVLNPLTNMATRVATFYDFRVSLSGFWLFVQSGKIEIDIEIKQMNFMAGLAPGSTSTDAVPSPNPYNFGTQFPWLATTSIRIGGSGTAVVQLKNANAAGEYVWTDDINTTGSVNVALNSGQSDVTEQAPGQTIVTNLPFTLEYYDTLTNPASPQWVNLFSAAGTNTSLFDLSQSVIKSHTFSVTPELMTAEFAFQCYVGPPNDGSV